MRNRVRRLLRNAVFSLILPALLPGVARASAKAVVGRYGAGVPRVADLFDGAPLRFQGWSAPLEDYANWLRKCDAADLHMEPLSQFLMTANFDAGSDRDFGVLMPALETARAGSQVRDEFAQISRLNPSELAARHRARDLHEQLNRAVASVGGWVEQTVRDWVVPEISVLVPRDLASVKAELADLGSLQMGLWRLKSLYGGNVLGRAYEAVGARIAEHGMTIWELGEEAKLVAAPAPPPTRLPDSYDFALFLPNQAAPVWTPANGMVLQGFIGGAPVYVRARVRLETPLSAILAAGPAPEGPWRPLTTREVISFSELAANLRRNSSREEHRNRYADLLYYAALLTEFDFSMIIVGRESRDIHWEGDVKGRNVFLRIGSTPSDLTADPKFPSFRVGVSYRLEDKRLRLRSLRGQEYERPLSRHELTGLRRALAAYLYAERDHPDEYYQALVHMGSAVEAEIKAHKL